MITFYRMGTPLPGHRKDGADYVKSVADYIASKHGVKATCAIKIGGAAGRVGVRLVFDDMAGLEAWIEKARADKAYVELTHGADGIMGETEDAVWKVL